MREQGIDEIEVHVAAVCIRVHDSTPQMLGLHRSAGRALFPGLWEGVGGQVHTGESFETAVLRHLREEAGLTGTVRKPFAAYVIEPGGSSGAASRIPGVRFLVDVDGSTDPTIDAAQHQAWRWLDRDAVERTDFIPGMLPQLREAFDLWATDAV
jgi:8-oxo-dGTP pyrophosphatase MutT (NUDIX family)